MAEAQKANPPDVESRPASHSGSTGFKFQGGLVLQSPDVLVSFWGRPWPTAQAERLTQFVKDFFVSDAMNVLAQYGITRPHVTGTTHIPDVHGILSDTDVQRILAQHDLQATCVICYLAPDIAIKDKDTRMCEPAHDDAFGYHWFFTMPHGRKMYYAVIPALTDACVRGTCPEPNTCSLSLDQTIEERHTQVTSHEVSEMLTDPEGTAWITHDGDENGDLCNGQYAHVTVDGRKWTVQKTYSHAHRDCQATAGAPIKLPV